MNNTEIYRKKQVLYELFLAFGIENVNKALIETLKTKTRSDFNKVMQKAIEPKIPLSAFEQRLHPLEALVTYLREYTGLKNKEIASLLKRSQPTITIAYKKNTMMKLKEEDIFIPLSIFCQRNHSVLESLTYYLHIEKKMGFNEMAKALHLDYKTVWTTVSRAKKKQKPVIDRSETKADNQSIDLGFSIIYYLQETFNISDKETRKLILENLNINLPISLFKNKRGTLDLLVKYLKDYKLLKNNEIALLLNKSQKTISQACSRIKDIEITYTRDEYDIPLKIFSDNRYSLLENLVAFLKDSTGYRYVDIAELLSLNQKTVWCTYNNKMKKDA